ncbi:MAG: chloride channel protein [Oxalobacter sp.]|nr:MAG: chloride channel protein [Oxalobacter sp.]
MSEDTSENDVVADASKTAVPRLERIILFWQRWYAWIAAPLLIGLAGVGVAKACDYAAHLNRMLLERYPYAPIFILPPAFALLAYLVRRFFRGTPGSGIPQTIAVMESEDPRKTSHLLSLRIAFGKALMLTGGLAVGASIGREGPTVQIGASIMHAFYGRGFMNTVEQRRSLVMAGGAAGIAAAFNTPLAGVMFAIEELGKKFVFNAHSSTLMTVIVSGLVSLALVGQYTYFGSTAAFLSGLAAVPVVIACGVLGGVAGGLFSRLMIKMTFPPPSFIASTMQNRPIVFAGFCGALLAIVAMLSGNMVLGSGYDATRATLGSDASVYSWYYGIAKFAATFLSSISGIPGGLFAPTLSVGAGLGDGLSGLFPGLGPHGAIVLLVMAAYLSGVTRSPLTALIITMEMTNGMHLLLPLAAAVLIANGVSKLISPTPLYHKLAERFMRI